MSVSLTAKTTSPNTDLTKNSGRRTAKNNLGSESLSVVPDPVGAGVCSAHTFRTEEALLLHRNRWNTREMRDREMRETGKCTFF